MAKVFLGVGHGGSDPGAVANGFKEAALNLTIALYARDELVRHKVEVMLSRTKDEYDPLADEIKECNAFNPDLAVDIHNNAGGGDGAEVYYYSKGGTSKTLAQNILNAIVSETGQNSRGIKTRVNSNGTDYYGFIRETKAPATIVECAFLDNKTDIKILDTVEEQKKMGVAIAHGVLKTLGISIKETTTAKQEAVKDNAPDAYAKEAIEWAVKNGILEGDGKGDYMLHSNITRQDMLVFLHRALK